MSKLKTSWRVGNGLEMSERCQYALHCGNDEIADLEDASVVHIVLDVRI